MRQEYHHDGMEVCGRRETGVGFADMEGKAVLARLIKRRADGSGAFGARSQAEYERQVKVKMGLKHALAIAWTALALGLAIGCGADEPPPDATLEELARLEAAGVVEAKAELARQSASAAVNANGASHSTSADSAPPDSAMRELALLSKAGNKDAGNVVDAFEAREVEATNGAPDSTSADSAPPDSVMRELAMLSKAGDANARNEVDAFEARELEAAEAKAELARQSASAAVNANGAPHSTSGESVPPDSAMRELALLSKAGNKDAGNVVDAFEARELEAQNTMQAAVVLARYSTDDDRTGERRGQAARELSERFNDRDLDSARALDLLNTIAPEASLDARRQAADRLARLSKDKGEWNAEEQMSAANELSRLITGHGIDAQERADAARRMVVLADNGDLDADNTSKLLDTIAPELSVSERREAVGELAGYFAAGEWNAETTKGAAEATFKAVTGVEMQPEERVNASVELVGEGIKRFGGDAYDDDSVDTAVELIKQTFSGELSTESVSKLLGLGP